MNNLTPGFFAGVSMFIIGMGINGHYTATSEYLGSILSLLLTVFGAFIVGITVGHDMARSKIKQHTEKRTND